MERMKMGKVGGERECEGEVEKGKGSDTGFKGKDERERGNQETDGGQGNIVW